MKIWVVNEGEHIPALTGKGRTMRAGMFAKYFALNGHDVTWWFSTFLHYQKEFYVKHDYKVDLAPNLHLNMLHVKHAYKKNISVQRILYCKKLAVRFAKAIESAPKPDVIYCSWPLIELAKVCVTYGIQNNIPVVLDIRDFWPDIFVQPFSGKLQNIAQIFINLLFEKDTSYSLKNATEVIGVVPKTLDFARKHGRILRDDDHCVYLAYSKRELTLQQYEVALRFWLDKGLKSTDFLIIYFGSLERIDMLNLIYESAQTIRNERIKFILCGKGAFYDYFCEKTKNMNNIILPGFINSDQIKVLADNAKIGLLPYANTEDFKDALPNKFGEYLSFSLPVLTSLQGLSKKIVEHNECGGYFDCSSRLNELILFYYNNLDVLQRHKQNALKLYEREFNADKVYVEFMHNLEHLHDESNKNKELE